MESKLHVILYIFLFFCCFSCTSESKKAQSGFHDFELKFNEINRLALKDPLRASKGMDSLLSAQKDSLYYYSMLVVKAKIKMLLTENDSSENLLCRVSGYYERNKEQPHADFLGMQMWNVKGNFYCRTAAFDSAVAAFRNACTLCRKWGDREKLMTLAVNLADAYLSSGHYDLSSYWYRYSLSLADSLQIPDEKRFPTYGGLGQVNMELRDFETCDFYFDLAGRYYEKMSTYEKRFYLNNRGNSYYYRQDYPSALRYFRRLLTLLQHYPEMEFERNVTLINLGDVFLSMNQTDSASYYLTRCYDFFHKKHNNSALYYIDTQLIELALKEGNLPLARKRMRQAVTPEYVEPNMVHIRNRYLQHYFEKAGDFKNAYYYLIENQRIDDSTRNERVKMRAAEIALKYRQDSTLMKKEILIRQKRNEVLLLNQWLYRMVVAGLLSVGVLTVIVFYRKRKRDRTDWQLRQTITSLRLDNIRSRISPHFIFNVLNREMALRKADNENLLRLTKLIRKNLEFTSHLSVTLADELDFVDTYIKLESRTLGNDFAYILRISPEVCPEKIQIPSMLLQIPVENAVKHALREKEGARRLWIDIRRKADEIEVAVCDNGGGYRAHSTHRGTGTGMKVITQTVQLLNSYNRRQISMTINNVQVETGEMGCEVRFAIPLTYSYQLKGK